MAHTLVFLACQLDNSGAPVAPRPMWWVARIMLNGAVCEWAVFTQFDDNATTDVASSGDTLRHHCTLCCVIVTTRGSPRRLTTASDRFATTFGC